MTKYIISVSLLISTVLSYASLEANKILEETSTPDLTIDVTDLTESKTDIGFDLFHRKGSFDDWSDFGDYLIGYGYTKRYTDNELNQFSGEFIFNTARMPSVYAYKTKNWLSGGYTYEYFPSTSLCSIITADIGVIDSLGNIDILYSNYSLNAPYYINTKNLPQGYASLYLHLYARKSYPLSGPCS